MILGCGKHRLTRCQNVALCPVPTTTTTTTTITSTTIATVTTVTSPIQHTRAHMH